MFSKSRLWIHISLIPLYITLALYFDLIHIPSTPSSSPILELALLKLRTATSSIATLPLPLSKLVALPSKSLSRTSASSSTPPLNPMQFTTRKSQDRGHADHGWLKTFHTFSFAMYHSPNHTHFGPLRVLNEDRISPNTGFGTHSHREFEIFSYVVQGELEHKDSMGNTEILKRGHIQMTSAGTGISHSEKAAPSSPHTHDVHFLQIWSLPHTPRLTPKYYTRFFSDAEKMNRLVRVVAPVRSKGVEMVRDGDGEGDGQGPAPVNSQLTMYAGLVEGGRGVEVKMEGRKGYVHVVMQSGYRYGAVKEGDESEGGRVWVGEVHGDGDGGVKGEGVDLNEGDGVYIFNPSKDGVLRVENVGDVLVEVLVFDLE
ncbi:hypothetical protein CVT24_008102 [Panaeolus cyanescens]|uniref:Pirin N-terminal domain-containing protein n=1 Tax=Panaeolus cyanescens TaxID=181874 RepID=A0A409YLG5_9AGAR|nr:hypothetical protein CVT24_008102 [Panaeolus cyanescens]